MAAAKKPAKKAAAKKVQDVAKPGTVTPDASSRPIIVTNRPILQDPMVVDEASSTADASAKDSAPPTPSSSKVTIKPLSATDTVEPAPETPAADTETPTEQPQAEPEENFSVPVKIGSKEPKKLETEVSAEAAAEPETTEAPGEPDSTETPQPEQPAEPEPKEAAASDDQPAAAETPEPAVKEESDKTDEDSADTAKQQSPEAADAAAKKAEEESAKHEAAIDQLAESKQYYLPIKTEEQRKSLRFVVLGAVLILVLGAAWLDVALDAGLVQVGSLKPLTHFFSHDSTIATPTAATPVVTYKTFTAPVAKLSFRYQSSWQLSDTGSSTQNDTIALQPPKAESTVSGVNAVFLSKPVANPTGSYTVKYVKYQKLAHQIGGQDVYLRDLVYQDAGGNLNAISSLGNDQTVKVGDTLKTLDQNFTAANGTDADYFAINIVRVAGGVSKFSSLSEAQKFLQTTQYQQARTILLSTAPQTK